MKKIMTSALVCVGAALAVVALAGSPPALAADQATAVDVGQPSAPTGLIPDKKALTASENLAVEKTAYEPGQTAAFGTDIPAPAALKEDSKTRTAATIDTSPTGTTTTASAYDSSGGPSGGALLPLTAASACATSGGEQQIGYLDS